MAGTSWSSSSSCTSSFGTFDDGDVVCVVKPSRAGAAAADGSAAVVKFLCSYGGRIQPRHTDGALRYVGGDTRVLSVDRRSLHFHELLRKMRELCGGWDQVCLRCQLPAEDLDDALVSVTSDDDLANLLDEYDAASKGRPQPLKIRAFLFPTTAAAAPEPPSSASYHRRRRQNISPTTCALRYRWQAPLLASRPAENLQPPQRQQHYDDERHGHRCLVHSGRHWQ